LTLCATSRNVEHRRPAQPLPEAKGKDMRPIVEPPPSIFCDHCRGELRLKQLIELVDLIRDMDQEIFVCVKCGREQSHLVKHDHKMPRLKAFN
jgi:hypothetical protein